MPYEPASQAVVLGVIRSVMGSRINVGTQMWMSVSQYSDWDTGWTTGKSGCISAKTEIFVLSSTLKPGVGVLSVLYPVNTGGPPYPVSVIRGWPRPEKNLEN